MAVNYTDFEKIWASTSPLTPYSFSDANYKRGWDFVGSTPPSRQMWDAFMQNADEKLQYLYLHEDVPVGHEYFTFNPNVPQGSLPLFGGEYSRETYSALWSWVQQQTGYLKTEAEWQTLATANNGNVPFYSDGDGSTTFRVPALKCYIKAADGTVTEVGSYYAAGLPNITGSQLMGWHDSSAVSLIISNTQHTGAFVSPTNQPITNQKRAGAATLDLGTSPNTLNFDASAFNSIYGNSNTVTPETVVGLWLVKAYGVIQDTGTINEQQYIDDRLGTKLSVNGGKMLGAISGNPITLTADDGNGNTNSLVVNANGTMSLDGNDMTPQIKTAKNGNSISVPNNTFKTLVDFNLGIGTWLVLCRADFGNNATGYRTIWISESEDGWWIDSSLAQSGGYSGGNVILRTSCLLSVSSPKTYYLVCRQASGGSLAVSGDVEVIRLSSIA